jgi:hypothetical protein
MSEIWFKSEPHEQGRKYYQLDATGILVDERFVIFNRYSGIYRVYDPVPLADFFTDLASALEALAGEPV